MYELLKSCTFCVSPLNIGRYFFKYCFRSNFRRDSMVTSPLNARKNGFVTATKSGTTNKYFVAVTTNFAAATKRIVDRTKYFAVVTNYFCYPYFNK